MDFAGLIDDGVHCDKTECNLTPIDHRSITRAGCADRHAGKRVLSDRCRTDACRSELFEQQFRCVRAEFEDGRVAAHFLGQSRGASSCVSNPSHYAPPVLKTSSSAASGFGKALAFA